MGSLLRYCYEGTLVEYDCVEEYTEKTTCMELDPVYGYGCALAVGEECYWDDGDDGIEVAACQGTNSGCVENSTTTACTENIGPCTDDLVGHCISNIGLVVLCSEFKQPNILDCVAFGGNCVPGRCANIIRGGFCNDENAFCASGLICREQACVPGESVDAGVKDIGFTQVCRPSRPDSGFGFPSSDMSIRFEDLPESSKSNCSCDALDISESTRDTYAFLSFFGLFALIRRRWLWA